MCPKWCAQKFVTMQDFLIKEIEEMKMVDMIGK